MNGFHVHFNYEEEDFDESTDLVESTIRNLRKDGDKNNASDEHIANLTDPKDCKALALKLSVSADGKSYTVFNPRNGHKRTFKTRQH